MIDKVVYGTDSIYVDLTGIQEVTESSLQILPNPATNQLFIKASGMQPQSVAIYDISGSIVLETIYAQRIDVSVLVSGVYFIEVKDQSRVIRKKFVKL